MWLVANAARSMTIPTSKLKALLVGISRGNRVIPGFHGWCALWISSIHKRTPPQTGSFPQNRTTSSTPFKPTRPPTPRPPPLPPPPAELPAGGPGGPQPMLQTRHFLKPSSSSCGAASAALVEQSHDELSGVGPKTKAARLDLSGFRPKKKAARFDGKGCLLSGLCGN